MGIIETIVQGIIQGLTEFLPVSSSGHLSIYQYFTGNSGESSFLLSAVLHLGTLVAVFIAFKDIILALLKECGFIIRDIFTLKFSFKNINGERKMIFALVLSLVMLIPFYLFKDFFTGFSTDSDIIVEGVCFLYTALILFLSDKCVNGRREKEDITVANAVTVGLFQGVALMPGISRSGSTICGGLFSGFSRELAISYSFILGIPTILGGCLLEIKDAADSSNLEIQVLPLVIGFIISAIVGIFAIKLVKWLMKNNKFIYFSYYTAILGITVIVLGVLGK